MTHQTQELLAPEAIGASTTEEINPKSTDRAPAEKVESAGQYAGQ